MATLKLGLDYFPMNVDFFSNDKLQLVSARFGIQGENMVLRLLCKVYGSGYFYRFGDDEMILLARHLEEDCGHLFVKEALNEIIKRGFFDKNIYERFRILTSQGIQRRYIEATGRRKCIELHEQLLLIDIPDTPNVIILNQNVCIITPNGDIIRQSKGKEKEREKEKENVENESSQAHINARAHVHEGEKQLTEEPKDVVSDYEKFQLWLKSTTPFCAERKHFPRQITEKQFLKLRERYTAKEIAAIIEQIENRKDLRKRYSNLYRTVLNWAKREYEN